MWNLQITNEISLFKNNKINILQIGFSNNQDSLWLLNNIMKDKNSKLYILNLWYQSDKNQEMMNEQSMVKFLKKDDSDKFFFKDLKEYSDKIINLKKKSEEMFNFFKDNNIFFDLIFIDFMFLRNPLTYLIFSWELLNKDGIFILINTNQNDIFNNINTFLTIYEKNIKLIKLNNFMLIKKIHIQNKNMDIPLFIDKIFDKYLKFKEYNLSFNIPNIHMKKIDWNFILNDNYINQKNKKYGYNYEIDKYINFIYDTKNSMFDKLKSLDINLFLTHRIEDKNILKTKIYNIDFKNMSIENKIIKIKNILNKNYFFKIDKLFKHSNYFYKKNNFNTIFLSSLKKYNLSFDYIYPDSQIKKFKKIVKNSKIKNNEFINIDPNLFNFNNIMDFININNNKKFYITYIILTRYIIENLSIKIYYYYSNILLLNLLYFILNIQKENGELYFILPPLVNNTLIQFLQILSNFYSNVHIEPYFNYSNYYSIVIRAIGFKGISKEELNNFYNIYYPFYEKNIHPYVHDMFLGKKIEGLYLDNIISNKIDKKLVKVVSDFNKKYHKEFLQNLKMKIDIFDFLNNPHTTKVQKDYIYDKLFKAQYKRFVEESRKMYSKKIN